MALTEMDARHFAAAQVHSAAMKRVRDLWDAAEKQRKVATEAALVGERLLEKIGTDDADLTDQDLLDAAENARREEALASIAAARVNAAMRSKHEAHIAELRAQRDILQATFDGAVTKLIEYGDLVDSLRAELDDAIAAYDARGNAVMEAHRTALHHNGQVGNEQHHHNAVLGAMGPAEQPRVTVPQYVGAQPVKLELYDNVGAGTISARRMPIFAVASRVRLAFNRPVQHDDAQ